MIKTVVNIAVRTVGEPGAIYLPRGEWNATDTYTKTSLVIEYVIYEGYSYEPVVESITGGSNPLYNVQSEGGTSWKSMGRYDVVATQVLLANFAIIAGAVFHSGKQMSQLGVDSLGTESSDFSQYGSNFTPYMLLDFLTGTFNCQKANIKGSIEAVNGLFSGLIRNTTHTRLFSVNEAVTSGFYYLTGNDDFNITVGSSYSEGSTLCLPTGKDYDGVKCTIVNSGVYDANDDFQGNNIKVMIKNSEVESQKSFYANSLASGNQILEVRLLCVSALRLWGFWRKDLSLSDGGELIWIIENPSDFTATQYDGTNYYLTSKTGQWT